MFDGDRLLIRTLLGITESNIIENEFDLTGKLTSHNVYAEWVGSKTVGLSLHEDLQATL